ncbi:MAG: histidinol dehydrogenase [Chloroflexi bacterium]|nr:histidinol dehydrogenase [Chloroflexota bacterium]
MSIQIIDDVDIAKHTILKRVPLEKRPVPAGLQEGIRRIFGRDIDPVDIVDHVIEAVESRGDGAVLEYTRRIDGIELGEMEVQRDEIEAAYGRVPEDLLVAVRTAAERIESFHRRQKRTSWVDFSPEGALGQIITPLQRVGVYVPGGRASYPSSLLMAAIPARVAGVKEVIVVSPPDQTGQVPPVTLVAADIAGINRFFKIGGAQAVAALAFGTVTIPRVDKIVGPGNLFVTLAKKKLFGQVGIDQLAGPTETVVIADESARPASVAADLLAQAEHDVMASAILLTPDRALTQAVRQEVEKQLRTLPRADLARCALESQGGVVLVRSIEEAIELSNDYAPEHLCLLLADPWRYVGLVRNAGGVFLGEHSMETIGDYVAGPSHIMPTGGTARFSSPLTLEEFQKITSLVAINEEGLQKLGKVAVTIAKAEGLTAHAAAVNARLED